ncbi:putative cyclophilin-type peptidyl-prolyl cis-trans isomerase domain-containing protein [Helianthus debilis subsp. tardiflorus]
MGRRQIDSEPTRWVSVILLLMGVISCSIVYMFMSVIVRPVVQESKSLSILDAESVEVVGSDGGCCRGIDKLELWGSAVKWGSDFKFNSSVECCDACKAMCSGKGGPCLCDSWVFCGDPEACGSKFGECWLKKQSDPLAPDRQEAGDNTIWTSGLVYGKGEGIVKMKTQHGTLHIKLLPECAPRSVMYILELLTMRHCAGCQFYRAEGRGQSWDSKGNHIKSASFGPPFALVQGTLEAEGVAFKKIPTEECPVIQRGSVAWIDSGPEFFISLANHEEWKNTYTVFGYVLPEDMEIAEKIATLPTVPDVWNNINVSVLGKPVSISVSRVNKVSK